MKINRIAISLFLAAVLIGFYMVLCFIHVAAFSPFGQTSRVIALPLRLPYYLFSPNFNDMHGDRLVDTIKLFLTFGANVPLWSVPVYIILSITERRQNKLP